VSAEIIDLTGRLQAPRAPAPASSSSAELIDLAAEREKRNPPIFVAFALGIAAAIWWAHRT
jgi:hypothetical protein